MPVISFPFFFDCAPRSASRHSHPRTTVLYARRTLFARFDSRRYLSGSNYTNNLSPSRGALLLIPLQDAKSGWRLEDLDLDRPLIDLVSLTADKERLCERIFQLLTPSEVSAMLPPILKVLCRLVSCACRRRTRVETVRNESFCQLARVLLAQTRC